VAESNHERAVREFMDRARAEDPERVAEVEARYPVDMGLRNKCARGHPVCADTCPYRREVPLDGLRNSLLLSCDITGRRSWASLVFRSVRMKPLVAFAAVAMLTLSACANPFAHKAVASPSPVPLLVGTSGLRCVDLVATAIVSPVGSMPAGAEACLDVDAAAEVSGVGLQEFVGIATPFPPGTFTRATYYGVVKSRDGLDVQVYRLTGDEASCLGIFTAGDMVDFIAFRAIETGLCG